MFHSIARKIVGPVFLLLGLLVALPASASVIVSCTGTLDAALTPGFTATPQNVTIEAQASIASSPTCTLGGTKIQPARLAITASFNNASCTGFALNPGTSMTITWDDKSTGTATYDPSSPGSFVLPTGPFAAQFLINSGHASGKTMVISALPPLSTALLNCLLPGAAPVWHLGAPIAFSVI
ncbi:hypothetical protein NLK61_21185 [Pseudomonas fuscovaginae UPB0736]|uniref:hypothetical protein n=1 Tax=Pseudomonas asplenii TaxID=53407 RepID=UPI0002887E9B|nr:hypothetical protein [Pseudomonas fuscovaginae]UUQ63746.1 hypothetical protein NLK61_21185 [Pseudomonas fuscovaginae UPB0736]